MSHIRVFSLLAALVLVPLAIACNGDDDDDGNGDETPTIETTATVEGSPTGDTTPTESAESPTPSDGGEGEEEQIEQAVRDAIEAYNNGEAEAFFESMTDEGVASFLSLFGLPTEDLEAAKEEAAPFIGEDPIENPEITVTESSEDSASAEVIGEAAGIIEGDRFDLVRQDDEWLINEIALFAVSPDVPDGYTTIDMGLSEFAFEFQDSTIEAGQIAFALENNGEQPHEVVLARLDEDVDLDEALQEETEGEPEGIEVLGGVFNVDPGASYNLVFLGELEAGRYAVVCFLPNLEEGPEGTPHAFLGMVQEFMVE